MGFFKKKHNDESEDFILDFHSFEPSGKKNDPDGGNDENNKSITPWDQREHSVAPHAMTVEEILGINTSAESDDKIGSSAGDKTSPAEETDGEAAKETTEESAERTAEEVIEEAAQEPIKETVKEPSKQHEDARATEIPHLQVEVPKKEPEIPSVNRINIPKGDEPIFEKADGHVDTDSVAGEYTKDDTAKEENYEEYINSIKKESLKKFGLSEDGEEKTEETPAEDAKDPGESVKTVDLSKAVYENKDEEEKEKEEPEEDKESLKDTQGGVKLSPLAQQFYDRMMAERAKTALKKDKEEKETREEDKEPSETEDNSLQEDTKPTVFKDEEQPSLKKQPSKIEEEKAAEVLKSEKSSEDIADAIFESLNDNLFSSPLTHHTLGGSLLDKCKSFVRQEPAKNESIDDIIHEAEKSARKRLFEKEKTAEKYDFGMFTDHSKEESQEETKPEPEDTEVKPSIFTENDSVKNLQYSLADKDIPTDIEATRRIDLTLNKDEANHIELNAESGRRAAPEKIEEIKLHLEKLAEKDPTAEVPHLNLVGDTESQLPDGDVKEFDEEIPVLDDYNTIADAQSVDTDLASKKVSITAKLIPTAVITAILFIIDYAFKDIIVAASPMVYSWLNFALFAVAFLVNFSTIRGITGIVMGVPDMDTPYALCSSCVLIYTMVTAITGTAGNLPVLAPAGVLLLLFNLLGKRSMLKRIQRGFKVIANNNIKNAVSFVEDKLSASVMAGGSVIGEALICEGKPTTNITGYLNNSYSEDAYEKRVTPLVIFTVCAAAVCAVASIVMGGDIYSALFAFTLVCIASCPVSAILVCNLPLSLASKKLKYYGAMLAGYKGADSVANANAVAFDAADLFPAGTIKLYNMQVLNSGAVDKYIAYSAAVLDAAKSPLSPIFKEILETNDEEIPLADSIKYENNMGLSGWIGEKRIFVGNRTLMEGHNIQTPSLELDRKILRQGYFPVYLAIDQQLCALFIIGYEADEEITYELRNLCSTGVTMLVNTNDPNITEEMLCDYFGLYKDSIKVLSPSGVTAYNSANQYTDSVSAAACYSENINGLLSAITSAIKIKSVSNVLMILQIIFICLGVGAAVYLTFTSSLLKLPSVIVAAAQLLSAAITAAVAYFNRP